MTAIFSTDGPTRVVRHMNAATLWNLPEWSTAPSSLPEQISALKAEGVTGFQHPFPAMLPDLGIPIAAMARIDTPTDAMRIAGEHKREGFVLTTLHVGTGWESTDEAVTLLASVIEASVHHDYPLLVETHRATATQDMRRTLDVIERLPELRFNADLSHWYTGHEMTYGDIKAKFDRLTPVFERVRYVHGRIGTPCCAQVALRGADDDREYVEHFRDLWKRVCRGFKATGQPSEVLPFAPELLPAEMPLGDTVLRFHYARLFEYSSGEREESDRWSQARVLWQVFCGAAREEGLVIDG